ncbi:MAG: hypothetical protein HY243_15625 [Proteobacteria bacterium]|nr:hypothetical protein [Pseudomonadota bacterium]
MRSTVLGCAAGVASIVMAIGPTFAADPFAGTWVLDVARSSYSPGPAPAAVTVTTREIGNGKFDTIIDVTQQNGKVAHFEVNYANDGADYSIAGPMPGETASSRYVGAETIESTLKIDGKPIGTTTEVMAGDLNTLTSTTIGTTPNGTPIRNVQVYDRK